jgi:hypothetical protein
MSRCHNRLKAGAADGIDQQTKGALQVRGAVPPRSHDLSSGARCSPPHAAHR